MLWRVRTTLPDRPGTLALLAQRCGEAGVNILGLQIFPGLDHVTDEFVLRAPTAWTERDVAGLLRDAGGGGVVVQHASDAALSDQPTRYVQAARAILGQPMSFPAVLARLFDAEAEPLADEVHDTMELMVGDMQMQVHRATPFTGTEHARGAAIADLVNDVLDRTRESIAVGVHATGGRVGAGATLEYVTAGDTVTAFADDIAVGIAQVLAPVEDPDAETRPLTVRVDPAWQRRGIGTRLLLDAARLAHALGADEALLTTHSDNQAVLPMVLAAGLRSRIRMAADTLTIRLPLSDLRPSRSG